MTRPRPVGRPPLPEPERLARRALTQCRVWLRAAADALQQTPPTPTQWAQLRAIEACLRVLRSPR